MENQIIDIERELILRVDEKETLVYLDFFTKDGLKTIKIQKIFYNDFLDDLNKLHKEKNGK